ncbi:hypothetical protein BKA93DRAFT_19864 [Sparassis latifolia]
MDTVSRDDRHISAETRRASVYALAPCSVGVSEPARAEPMGSCSHARQRVFQIAQPSSSASRVPLRQQSLWQAHYASCRSSEYPWFHPYLASPLWRRRQGRAAQPRTAQPVCAFSLCPTQHINNLKGSGKKRKRMQCTHQVKAAPPWR